MEGKCLEYSTNHVFDFDITTMKQILLRKYKHDHYKTPFNYCVEYKIPDSLASIIDLHKIEIKHLITFYDDKIEVVSNKTLDILTKKTNTKFKILYQVENNKTSVFFKIKVDLQFLPSFIITLINPMFDYIVESIFMNERKNEQDIFDNYI